MPKTKINWFDWIRMYTGNKAVKKRIDSQQELKPYLVDDKYRVIPAFTIGDPPVNYFMYDSSLEIPTGRFLAARAYHIELESNCDKEYLALQCRAIETILTPKKGQGINLGHIAQINKNLQERLTLLPSEEAIYKFASVIFFDKTESLYSYDYEYNINVKIPRWKAAGGSLDFFSRTPLVELLPVLTMPEKDFLIYSETRKMVTEIHQHLLTDMLQESQ